MLPVQFFWFVIFAVIFNSTSARPNDFQPIETLSDTNKDSVTQVPPNDLMYGMIFNFTSSFPIDSETIQTSSNTSTNTSSPNREKLVRKKRFLFGILEYAFQSLRSGNWRECGATPWGSTIYTNGIATACFGACPENVYCGYGYNGYNGYYGGGTQINTVHFG